MNIREMAETDYDQVYQLWLSCAGMGLNDLDDSKEGIARKLVETVLTVLDELKIHKVAFGRIQKECRRKQVLGEIRILCSRRSHLPQSTKD